MKKMFFLLCVLCCLVELVFAEDGSKLWLRTAYKPNTDLNIKVVGGHDRNGTLDVAKQELSRMGWQGEIIFQLYKGKKQSDAYSIKSENGKTIIRSTTPVGVLYGVYDLLRRKQMGESLKALSIEEEPTYDLRMLNHWDNLDGTIERGYAGHSLWKWQEMPKSISPRYEQYARACASVGINASVLNNVNAASEMLSIDYLQKVKVLADIFRPYGIKVYLCVNFDSPKDLGGVPTADPLDDAVIQWWKTKVKELYSIIPDFGGFLVKANSEGKTGPCDYGRTHADGANMLADALKPYGGVVMWRAFVYKPASKDRAMQAALEFEPLDGHFHDNVIIQIKNGPVDFQPREPFNPLFGRMPHTQQMVEFQITQEYLGASNHLLFQVPLWKECLDSDTYVPQLNASQSTTVVGVTANALHYKSAIAGVANIGDDTNWCGHLFAQANWYAFGRLAWNESLTAEQIAQEWLKQTFTADRIFVEPMTKMMLDTRNTLVNYMMPLGLHHIFAEVHHYGPAPWYNEEGLRADWSPLYYHRADASGVGFDRTMATGSGATGQYADPWKTIFEHRKTCPDEYVLWFHHVGWRDYLHSGRTLWEEMCYRYSLGLASVRNYQKVWDTMKPYVDDERFLHVQNKLKIQTHDAQWWKDACLLYFQQFSKLPFPADMERPVYELDRLMNFHIGLGTHGCPTRDMLP